MDIGFKGTRQGMSDSSTTEVHVLSWRTRVQTSARRGMGDVMVHIVECSCGWEKRGVDPEAVERLARRHLRDIRRVEDLRPGPYTATLTINREATR